MIKIERKETPHTQEAMDDLQESCSTGHSYNTEHVNQALREVFHGKCYICENKEATSYQIEHLIPHRGDKKLKYDWNNLFWVCAHCNNIKSDKYEPILNSSEENGSKDYTQNVAKRSFKVQRICKGVSGRRERRGKREYCDASEEGTERQFCVYGI